LCLYAGKDFASKKLTLEDEMRQQATESSSPPLSSVDEIVEEISVCSLPSILQQHITCYTQFC